MKIKAEFDPMGCAINDYCKNHTVKKLIVNSTITENEEIEVSYLFRDFDSMPDIEQKALRVCKGSVLDVGAAAGIHSLWLQNSGLNVKAIDVSELSVEAMKSRGVNQVECVDFFESKNQKYDTLLFLMNGVGISGDLNGLNALLLKCKELLNEGGQVLLDSSDIIYMFDGIEEFSVEPNEYYGELQYEMQYGSVKGNPFRWLFIAFNILEAKANVLGFKCELVQEGEHFDYLAKLTLRD